MRVMDDRDAYVLNNLWSRYYDLGRIVRFRHVTRGRQATVWEVLTAAGQIQEAFMGRGVQGGRRRRDRGN